MKTDQTIQFVHDPSHFIRIESIEQYDDGSGFCSDLSIQSGGFACLGRRFFFNDLMRFAKDMANLSKRLRGTATLGPDYEPDFVRFEATKLGHVIVSGDIEEHGEHQHLMKFSFETDQTYLHPFLESLESTLESLK